MTAMLACTEHSSNMILKAIQKLNPPTNTFVGGFSLENVLISGLNVMYCMVQRARHDTPVDLSEHFIYYHYLFILFCKIFHVRVWNLNYFENVFVSLAL